MNRQRLIEIHQAKEKANKEYLEEKTKEFLRIMTGFCNEIETAISIESFDLVVIKDAWYEGQNVYKMKFHRCFDRYAHEVNHLKIKDGTSSHFDIIRTTFQKNYLVEIEFDDILCDLTVLLTP